MSDIGRHPEGNDEIRISPIDKPAAQYGSFIHLGYPFGGMSTRSGGGALRTLRNRASIARYGTATLTADAK